MHLDPASLHKVIPAVIVLIISETVYLVKEHRHDYKDMFSSVALLLGSLAVSLFTTGAVVYAYSFIYQFRIFTMPSNQWWVLLLLFLGDDFSYYWFHRLSHQVRFLWASHVVHHSSQKFTFTAALRVPWTSTLTGNFLFWAWMPFTGFEPYLVLFMKSVSVIYQFWMHTETINKLPKWFESIFNTPSHHRVHHASNVEYLDKNHAGTLIIWDKLFGTYQEEIVTPTYGLTENIRSCNPFVIAFHGWKGLLNDFKKTSKLSDRFRYFFYAPGWSHDGSSQTTKQLQALLKKSNNHSPIKFKKMKIFVSITAIALIILMLAVHKAGEVQPGKTINTIMTDGILQSIEEVKKTGCESFVVPIRGTTNTVAFRDDGTVYVHVGNSKQTFDVTNLQQMHRFYDLDKLLQSHR